MVNDEGNEFNQNVYRADYNPNQSIGIGDKLKNLGEGNTRNNFTSNKISNMKQRTEIENKIVDDNNIINPNINLLAGDMQSENFNIYKNKSEKIQDKVSMAKNSNNTVKFKEENYYSDSNMDENKKNLDNIKNILDKADFHVNLPQKNWENYNNNINNSNSNKNSNNNNENNLNLLKLNSGLGECENEYNIINNNTELNHNQIQHNNNFDSPNMIKNSIKMHSNSKNNNVFEFQAEKNISNTTFRAGSEANKNK